MRPLVLALALAAAACAAQAAPFADPTRPPLAPEAAKGGAALPGGPRLESVLIAPDRRLAVISGQQVTLGSRFGDGEVVRITESEVLIRKPDGEESLKLFAGGGRRPPAARKGK
jgi:MSHA biogenesis protein MshK